jgi:hypothetical protein
LKTEWQNHSVVTFERLAPEVLDFDQCTENRVVEIMQFAGFDFAGFF